MKTFSKFFFFLTPLLLIISCWDETTSPEDKKVEPITIKVLAVKDSLGTIFESLNDSTATPENVKSLYVKTQDLDYIDSIGAIYYTGQSLEIGGRISIACDNISDSVFTIGSLTFPNTGTYKVFYFAKIIDSVNLTFVDTINFVVGGVAPIISANSTSDTIFTVKELNELKIEFKAEGQYSSSNPYFSSISNLPAGAAFDSTTGIFSYIADTSIAPKDSSTTLSSITVTAYDNSYPPVSSTYNFFITVTDSSEKVIITIDSISPVITIASNNPDTLYVHESYTYPAVTVSDNIEGDISSKIIKIGTIDSTTLGEQFIYYSVSDTSGNIAYDTLVVFVIDTTPPVVNLAGLNPDTVLLGGGAYSDPGATALDNADGLITFDKFTVTGTVNKDSLGIYTRTYNVADASGNAALAVTRTVVVIDAPDTTAPIVMINGGDKNDTIWVGDSYTLPIAMASDNKDGMIANAQIIKTPSSATTTAAGTFKFVYTATDVAGNIGTDTLTLVVKADTIAPVITILGKEKDTINVGDNYTLLSAVAIDNKDDTLPVSISGTVNNSVAGSNIITYTATDAAGNESSKLVIVLVKDIAPVITVQPRDTSIDIEKTVTFSVTATGTNLSYQWQKNGVNISQAIFNEYTTPAIAKGDTNSFFTCVVSNSAGSVSSVDANLTPVWIVSVSAGSKHSTFLKSDGTLWACGTNSQSQLGYDTLGNVLKPIKILSDVKSIPSIGGWAAIKNDNSLWVSRNYKQYFNNSSTTQEYEKVYEDILEASCGSNIIIKDASGKMWATGANGTGEAGDSTVGTKTSPVSVRIEGEIIDFSAGSMFIKSDNTLWVTGNNYYAQLGTGDSLSILVPTQIKSNIIKTFHAGSITYYVDNQNNLWGAGRNQHGQLGLSDSTDRIYYTKLEENVKKISASSLHTILLKSDGSIYSAGLNTDGQLGINSQTKKYEFVEMDIVGEIDNIFAGYKSTFILKKDGTLWACGDNMSGQLGDGTQDDKLKPVKISF